MQEFSPPPNPLLSQNLHKTQTADKPPYAAAYRRSVRFAQVYVREVMVYKKAINKKTIICI